LFRFEHAATVTTLKCRKMVDFNCGTGFGYLISVKMKFSNKDVLLLLGIVVAVIISLTVLVFQDDASTPPKTTSNSIEPKTSLAPSTDLLKRAIDKIEFNSLIR